MQTRRPQVAVLGSAEPGSEAYRLAEEAGRLLAQLGITLVSGCGSPATRIAAQRAVEAGGEVVAISPTDAFDPSLPCTVLIPCGMGDARNLLMAVSGDAAIVIAGRAGTLSEVSLAWLHRRPLLPLTGCGGWSDRLVTDPPDERGLSRLLPWSDLKQLEAALRQLGLVRKRTAASVG